MFYEHNQVEDLLNCLNCGERYDRPLLLPCYKTICERCMKKNNSRKEEECELNFPYCSKQHKVPQNGFAVNETIMSLLKIRPVNAYKADLFRKLAEATKKLQANLNELCALEDAQKIVDLFEVIKKEINQNTESLIEQANKYREKMFEEIDYAQEVLLGNLKMLFKKGSRIADVKRACAKKAKDWSNQSKVANMNEHKLNNFIGQASSFNLKLTELKQFVETVILGHKCVFNQREPTSIISMASIIGEIDFTTDSWMDHAAKLKFVDDLIQLQPVKLDASLVSKTVSIVPLMSQKLLNIAKETFDDVSDIRLSVLNRKCKTIYENKENFSTQVNACTTNGKFIVLSTKDLKSSLDTLKLYDLALNLLNSIQLDHKCEEVFANDAHIYVRCDAHPFLIKFDLNLKRMPLLEKVNQGNELFVSFIVDKLVSISTNARLYFSDKCFSKLKIYSEQTFELVDTIHVENLRDCLFRIDDANDQDQIILFNQNQKSLTLFDERGKLVIEKKLSDALSNVNEFYLTRDGHYAFVDYLNDTVYFY